MHNADRATAAVQHRQRVEVSLAAERFQHLGGGGVLIHGGLLIEQGAQVTAFVIEGQRGVIRLGQHQARFLRRLFLRAAEQVALDQVDAHLGQHRQFFWQFDALGNHLGAGCPGDLQDRADKLALEGVLVNAVDKVPVDLHVVRAQFGPQPQAGITGAQVIQCDGKTHVAVVVQGGLQQREIVGGRLLGEFDHHLAGRNTEVAQQLQGAPWLMRVLHQGFR